MSALRNLKPDDYHPIINIANDWWGSRPIADILLRVFFEHFQPMSFALEQDSAIEGFLTPLTTMATAGRGFCSGVVWRRRLPETADCGGNPAEVRARVTWEV
jgi:hypothetical protein